MLKAKRAVLGGIALLMVLSGCCFRRTPETGWRGGSAFVNSLVRVNVVRQNYQFHRPWLQGAPSRHTGIGVVVRGPKVLVTVWMMANHRYVELEKLGSGKKGRAKVSVIDYEANLALLEPLDQEFLADMKPLEITTETVEGDHLKVLQVKRNGDVVATSGPVTSIELLRYPSGSAFLAYRLNGSLQFRFANFTLPVTRRGSLAGLLMGYDAKAQSIDIIPAPLILHFLQGASGGVYRGFPRLGLRVSAMTDPQLRRFIGIPETLDGVYVREVARGSAGEKAGIRVGDVIMEMGGRPVDRYGNYEHPLYGKISLAHLIRCEFHDGDRILLKIFRNGKVMEKEVFPEYIPPEDLPVPPFLPDSPPRYVILGGLVLQELSLPYLREYGAQWNLKAPVSLVYYQKNQYTLDLGGREKIVILSRVLRTSCTIGYGNLTDLVVSRINNRPIRKLEDVPETLKHPVEGFHKIEFEDHPRVIYVDPGEMDLVNQEIMRRYRLPALQYLGDR